MHVGTMTVQTHSLRTARLRKNAMKEKRPAGELSAVEEGKQTDQNVPNRNVRTAVGPLRSAFVDAGELTPETYR